MPGQCAVLFRKPVVFRGLLAVAMLGCAICTTSAQADAQPPKPPPYELSDTDRKLAVRLGREAVALYNEQRFEDAFDRFADAETLVHSPVFVLYMARIERHRGRWRLALAHFDTVLSEDVSGDAPEAWRRAHQEARLERERLSKAVPTLVIRVRQAPPEEVSVWIDGAMVHDWQVPAPIDPGAHQVVAQWKRRVARSRVTVTAGQKSVPVQLAFESTSLRGVRAVIGTELPKPSRASPPAAQLADAPPGAQRIAGYSLLGLGGLATLATAGVGIGALITVSNLADDCLDEICPTAVEGDVILLDDLNRAALGLGVASALMLVTGWIVTASAKAETTGKDVTLTWGIQGLGVGGTITW